MDFIMGNKYEFTNEDGETIVFKFIEEGDMKYRCVVMGGTHGFVSGEQGTIKNVYKNSRVLKWNCNQVGNLDFGKSSGVVKKRRTPAEIQMDTFIENCMVKYKIEQLKVTIDEALAAGQKSVFMALTKELNKLQKKVTA